MNRFDQADDPRRRLLIQALATGLFSAGLPAGRALAAELLGGTPSKLPAGRSIYRISGSAMVNGNAATLETLITTSDTIETAKGSEIVFVAGDNAFILREESQVALETTAKGSLLVSACRLVTGKLLSVFPSSKDPRQMRTSTATIGIRGTGVYLESDPEQTYFCTCYGVADVTANNDPESKDTVVATHHDKPLYILATAEPGQSIRRAPFVNHTDQELMLIETLVGRTPPFVFPKDIYRAPRRTY